MNFNDFTLQRNMIFDDFPDPFRYKFWHCFLMSCGIDFAFMLEAFWHKLSCFGVLVFFHVFLDGIFSKFEPKMVPKLDTWRDTLRHRSVFFVT